MSAQAPLLVIAAGGAGGHDVRGSEWRRWLLAVYASSQGKRDHQFGKKSEVVGGSGESLWFSCANVEVHIGDRSEGRWVTARVLRFHDPNSRPISHQ